MGTMVKEEHLYESSIKRGENYLLGELDTSKLSEDDRVKYSYDGLENKELMGRFYGLNNFIYFMDENYDKKFGGRMPKRGDSSKREDDGDDWVKYSTFDECREAILNTPEVFRNFKEADIALTEYDSLGNDIEYAVCGDFLDIGRVMTGEPESFGSMKNGRITSKFANIILNGQHRWSTKAEYINKKAQRTARLVDWLEHNNIRCNITIMWSNEDAHLELVIKRPQDILNINDICVGLSADFFRRYSFAWAEHSAKLEDCYGTARSYYLEDLIDERANINLLVNNHVNLDIDEKFDELEKMIIEHDMSEQFKYSVV